MRKALAVLVLLGVLLALPGCSRKVIGKIRGPEFDTIVVDQVEYARVDGSGTAVEDRGDYLGVVTDGGNITFRVFTVKQDPARQYLYCLWDYEGIIYQRATG